MRALRFALPLAVFALLMVFLYLGLDNDPRLVPSPLLGKAAPEFTLPSLADPARPVSSDGMRGRVWLLNVWGSWCDSCRAEHGTLLALAKTGRVPIIGLNWRDERGAAVSWLAKLGNPYTETAADATGRTAIDYGVYGAPETFIIDRNGTIRDKVIGPLTPELVEDKVLPLVDRLSR